MASIVVAPLMLFGAMHTAQSISSGARIQLAAGGDSTFHRYTYIQKARGAMHEWQKKLHDFSEKAKAKGQEEGIAAEKAECGLGPKPTSSNTSCRARARKAG